MPWRPLEDTALSAANGDTTTQDVALVSLALPPLALFPGCPSASVVDVVVLVIVRLSVVGGSDGEGFKRERGREEKGKASGRCRLRTRMSVNMSGTFCF